HPATHAGSRGPRPGPRPPRAVALHPYRGRSPRRARRSAGKARARTRPAGLAGDARQGPRALRFAAGDRGRRPTRRGPQDPRGRTLRFGRLRLLRLAAGGPGQRLRRAMADRLAGLRRTRAAPARARRGRAHRRLHPCRHAAGRAARARTSRPAPAADRLGPGMNAPAGHRPTLYLVDASMYVFRAWHSMPDEFHDAEGWPTNAVHGFARFLLELLDRA